MLFKELILRNGGRLAPTLDLSSLAKISDGYTPGHIITAVKHVLTERRVQQVLLYACLSVAIILTVTLDCKYIRYSPVKIATQHFLELTFFNQIFVHFSCTESLLLPWNLSHLLQE